MPSTRAGSIASASLAAAARYAALWSLSALPMTLSLQAAIVLSAQLKCLHVSVRYVRETRRAHVIECRCAQRRALHVVCQEPFDPLGERGGRNPNRHARDGRSRELARPADIGDQRWEPGSQAICDRRGRLAV